MRYLIDNSLTYLTRILRDLKIDSVTAVAAARGDPDSTKSVKDAEILRYLLEMKYNLSLRERWDNDIALVTTDKDLAEYCKEFQLPHFLVKKPDKRDEFDEIATKLAKLVPQNGSKH